MASNVSSRYRLRFVVIVLVCAGLLGSTLWVPSEAQVTTNITSMAGAGNLGTIVTPGGATTTITGGTRPGNGTNLFHSFGQFTIGTGDTANFFNETHLSTTNILSRVTGGNPSNIFGTIQTTGFPGANLFLINPAGVVFGPTAQLHVEGSFHVSTADYLRLADGVRLTAVPGPQDALLSAAPVAAFGFLSNNPAPITVQGSVLVMPPGQTLSLIGGDIQALGGQVSAPAGLIQLASVASTGEVVLGVPGLSLDPLNVSSFSRLGRTDIQLSALDVSGTPEAPVGGAILIRSGRLVMDNAALLSNTVALSGGPISIASQTIEMNGGLIQTATLGPGAAGDLLIATGTLTLTEGALITSNTFGTGQGGKLTVAAGESLMLLGETPGPVTIGGVFLSHLPSGISTVAFADGQGGQIRVSTPTLAMQKGVILAETFGTGNAGEIFVNAGKLVLTDGAQIAASSSGSSGKGGNVMVRATDSITIDGNRTDVFLGAGRPVINGPSGFFTNADGMGDGGVISVSSPILTIGDGQGGGQIAAQTFGPANAGSILVEVGSLTLANGALISGVTLGAGQGGNVTVTATDSISISGRHPGSFGVGSLIFNHTQSGIVSLALAEGKAGRISVSTANLSLHDEGIISAATGGAGAAGDVTITATNMNIATGGQISSSSGVRIGDVFALGTGAGGTVSLATGSAVISGPGSGVLTSSAGNGAGGNIEFRAGSLLLQDSATIDAETHGTGKAGDIALDVASASLEGGALITSNTFGRGQGGQVTVRATESLSLSGESPNPVTIGGITWPHLPSTIESATFGDGQGGRIAVSAPILTMQKGNIGADTFGSGNAGVIVVNVGRLVLIEGALITAATNTIASGDGGSITVRATDSIFIDGHRTDRFPSGDIFVTNAPGGIFTNTFGTGKGGVISVSSPILTMGDGQGGGQIGAQSFGPADAGSLVVEVGSLTLKNGATISGTTLGAGQGGNVTVTATDSISISGRHPGSFGVGPLIFNNTQSAILSLTLGAGKAGRISVSTGNLGLHDEGGISAATGGAGAAGDVVVNTGTLSLTRVGQITSTSGVQIGDTFYVGDGAAGSVTVNTNGPVMISGQGSGIFTNAVGNGTGGAISLRGSQIQLTDGATITAKSFGTGNAGNISVTAGDRLVMRDSTVTTQAKLADGGNITIRAGEVVQLINSDITTSVGQGLGNGGNIRIDPQFVILQNGSRILANAFGGNGGNINITAGLLLISPDSVINASSALGVSGTITINSAISDLSGSLTPLPQGFLRKGVLLSSRCAARVGGSNSSFVVAGREAVPMEPGGLLPSPLPESGGLAIAESGSGLLSAIGMSATLEAGLEQGCGS